MSVSNPISIVNALVVSVPGYSMVTGYLSCPKAKRGGFALSDLRRKMLPVVPYIVTHTAMSCVAFELRFPGVVALSFKASVVSTEDYFTSSVPSDPP